MTYVIRLLGLRFKYQRPTAHDGQLLKSYDPYPVLQEGCFVLETTDRPQAALQFATYHEAMTYWQQSIGKGSNGKLNRPLTVFDISVESVQDHKEEYQATPLHS
jgi:hypothetical protein